MLTATATDPTELAWELLRYGPDDLPDDRYAEFSDRLMDRLGDAYSDTRPGRNFHARAVRAMASMFNANYGPMLPAGVNWNQIAAHYAACFAEAE